MTKTRYYDIPGCTNTGEEPGFFDSGLYNNWNELYAEFQDNLISIVNEGHNRVFLRWSDGEYYFLKKTPIGSATPGRRSLSPWASYDTLPMDQFRDGCLECDYTCVEIHPFQRQAWAEIFPDRAIDYPFEFIYGAFFSKWFLQAFGDKKISIIGAQPKLEIIDRLMRFPEYQDYLQFEKFNELICIPQKGTADHFEEVEEYLGKVISESDSDIFLFGMGQTKMAIAHRLKKYGNALFLDAGHAIDGFAGLADPSRPYAAGWTNYKLPNFDYSIIDFCGGDAGKGKQRHLG